ncbi:RDD family protein [Paenibacillus gorillae]|uniref:RDD family protein n=1 Tax=Paenibacillus gorillae TaxID=1243662 RepID=UPI0004AF881F|nr:RDD family protein [Paenibacillus gorillae]
MEQYGYNKRLQHETVQEEEEGTAAGKVSIEALCTIYGGSIVLRRWLAAIIDFIIMILFVSFWDAILKVFFQIHTINLSLLDITTYILFIFFYYSLLEGLTGYTIGKFFLGIRVVDEQGDAPGLVKALIRSSTRLLECNPFLAGGLPAGLIIIFTRRKQRLGDLAAKTYVVRITDLAADKQGNIAVLKPVFLLVVLFGLVGGFFGVLGSNDFIHIRSADVEEAVIEEAALEDYDVVPSDNEFISEDKRFKIIAPYDWMKDPASEGESNFTLVDPQNNMIRILYRNLQPDEWRDGLLDEYKEAFLEDLETYADVKGADKPFGKTIDGYKALQFTVLAEVDGYDYRYIATFMQTESAVYQIVTASFVDQFEQVENVLLNMIDSFREKT